MISNENHQKALTQSPIAAHSSTCRPHFLQSAPNPPGPSPSSKSLLLAVLLLLPLDAYAFGVAAAPLFSYMYALFLGLVGVAGYSASKGSLVGRRVAAISFVLLACFLGARSYLSDQYLVSALENEHFPDQVSINFNPDEINFIALDDAVNTYRSSNSILIRILERKITYIQGGDVFYYKDAKKIAESLADKNLDNIIIASQYMAEGITAYQELSSALDVPVHYLDIANTHVPSMLDVNDVGVELTRHTGLDLDKYSYLTIYGPRSYNTHIREGSYLISELSLLFWSDQQWSDLKVRLGGEKPIKILLAEAFSGKIDLIRFVASKLKLNKAYYEIPVGEEGAETFIPFLYGYANNELTDEFVNSGAYLSPPSFYAKAETNSNIAVICFSDLCAEQFPKTTGRSPFLSVINASTDSLFSIQDGKLSFNLSSLDPGKTYILSPENSSSLMLSINMAKAMSDAGLSFEGFTYHFSNYYGSVFNSGNSNDPFIYDSPPISLLTDLLILNEHVKNAISLQLSMQVSLALSLLIAILYSIGPKSRVAALTALVLTTLYVQINNDHLAAIEYYLQPFVIGLLSAALSLIHLAKPRKETATKGALVRIIAFVGITLVTTYFVHQMPFSSALFYGFSMLFIIAIEALKRTFRRLHPHKQATIGDKYALTIPFVKNNKGYLVTYPNFILAGSKLTNADTWIIRSNHLTPEENGAAGIFESKVSPSRSVRSELKRMIDEASKQLDLSNVQFWVQPYVHCSRRGVIESIAQSLFFSIGHSYSDDNNTSVNDGSNHANYVLIDRHSKNKADRQIISMLTKIETSTGYPVVVEYGIDLKGDMHVFQVRRQSLEMHFDEEIAVDFIKTAKKNIYSVETCQYSPLQQSILYRLYGKSVFIDAVSAYRKKGVTTKFDQQKITAIIHQLVAQEDMTQAPGVMDIGVSGIINYYADILAPLNKMHCKETDIISENAITTLGLFAHHAYGENRCPPASAREFLRLPYMIALNKVISAIKSIHGGKNIEMASLKAITRNSALDIPANTEEYIGKKIAMSLSINPAFDTSYEIYPGDFLGDVCSLEDSLRMTPYERSKCILKAESIPSGTMGVVKDHAGVISLYGGPLSHLAITARHYRIPCRIGREHFLAKP